MADTGRDIGWAISMMRKGGRVHRTGWTNGAALYLKQGAVIWSTIEDEWLGDSMDLLATDWELAGE